MIILLLQAERDALIKRVIPNVNRKLAPRLIRIVPVDLRWGVLAEESSDCKTIQKTCLNQVDKCRKVIFNGTLVDCLLKFICSLGNVMLQEINRKYPHDEIAKFPFAVFIFLKADFYNPSN